MPVLSRKPGALRNGAPFKGWVLPGAVGRVQRKLTRLEDGDRQVVTILSTVLSDGLEAVDTACQEALAAGVASADVILNILEAATRTGPSRQRADTWRPGVTCGPGGQLRPLRHAARGASCNDLS